MTPQHRAICVLAAVAVGAAQAQFIDFEKMPDGSLPTDGLVISNQFLSSHGVSFAFTNGTFPQIAQVGPPLTAFASPAYGDDTLAPNQNCGTYFLTDSTGLGTKPPPLVITYTTNVSAASGVILDIDRAVNLGGNEAWDIEARNGTNVLETVQLRRGVSPNANNSLATPWHFQRPTADITSIWIIYTGGKSNKIGLAFDNFSPALPISPASLSGMSMSATGLALNVNANFGQGVRVEYADSFPSTNWQLLTNVFLTNTPSQQITDQSWTNSPRRFYRAISIN